ncbi:MAG: hypothetical protein ACRENQ_04855 [Gemmatimonadaceae bacterium]
MFQRTGARLIGAAAVGAVVVGVGMVFTSCSSDGVDAAQAPTTEYGAAIAVGNGTGRSYQVVQNGAPIELGMALSQGALDSLPSAPKMGGYEYLLPLPSSNLTQYQVIGLNWNPTGHPPAGVYNVPHFDFHFYMVSLAERNAIDPSDPAFASDAANLPGAAFSLANYHADPPANAVPHMGLHWTDSTAAEFHGQPFTRTYIVGSWNGRFIFAEPMVARSYLLTHPDEVVPVGSTSQRAIAGYYPSGYRVSWDAVDAEWHVAITGLSH